MIFCCTLFMTSKILNHLKNIRRSPSSAYNSYKINYFRSYKPMDYYDNNTELRKAINQIRDNHFSPTEPGAFQDIVNSLLHHDR